MVNSNSRLLRILGGAQSALQPLLLFPLSEACASSISANFGTASVTSEPAVLGNFSTVSNTYPMLANTIWFPSGSFNFPATPLVYVEDTSANYNLDIFGGSFTISFFMALGTPAASDQPILEFLGASPGELCLSVRLGCYGYCVYFIYMPDCYCQAPCTSLNVNGYIPQITSWMNYAFVYNANTNLATMYLNGAFLTVYSLVLTAPTSAV